MTLSSVSWMIKVKLKNSLNRCMKDENNDEEYILDILDMFGYVDTSIHKETDDEVDGADGDVIVEDIDHGDQDPVEVVQDCAACHQYRDLLLLEVVGHVGPVEDVGHDDDGHLHHRWPSDHQVWY